MTPSRVFPSSIPIRRSMGRKGIVTTILDDGNYYVDFGRGEAELAVLLGPSVLRLKEVVRGWLNAEGDVWRIIKGKYPLVVIYSNGAFFGIGDQGKIVPWASPGIGVGTPGFMDDFTPGDWGHASHSEIENHYYVLEDGLGYLTNTQQLNWAPSVQLPLVSWYTWEPDGPETGLYSTSVDRAIWTYSVGGRAFGRENHYRQRVFACNGRLNEGSPFVNASDGTGRLTLVAVKLLPNNGGFGPEIRYSGYPYDGTGVYGESMHWHPNMTHLMTMQANPITWDGNAFGSDVGLPPGFVPLVYTNPFYMTPKSWWSEDGLAAIVSGGNGANYKTKSIRAWGWTGTGWGAELPSLDRSAGGPDIDGAKWLCFLRNNQYVAIYGIDQPLDYQFEDPFTSRLSIHPWSPVTGIGPKTDEWSWEWDWSPEFQTQNDVQRGFGAGELNPSPDGEYILFSRETSDDGQGPVPNEVEGAFSPTPDPFKSGFITVIHVSPEGVIDRRWEVYNGTAHNGTVGSDRATAWWWPNYRS